MMLRSIAFLLVMAILLPGCSGLPGSYDALDEQVHIRMLTAEQLGSYAGSPAPGSSGLLVASGEMRQPRLAAPKDFADQLEALKNKDPAYRTALEPGRPGQEAVAVLPALAVAAIPIVAGFAVDAIQHALDAEAARYEAQYGSSVVHDGFWKDVRWVTPRVDGTAAGAGERYLAGTPAYVGFEVIRTTRASGKYDGTASWSIYLFLPSKADAKLFLIHPFYSHVEHAKAKLAGSGGSASIISDIKMDSIWVDAGGRTVRDTVASARFERGGVIPGRDAGDFKLNPQTQAAGWFAGVPVSRDKAGNPQGTGVFRLTVNVTERDETKARAIIERISRFAGDNRDKIIDLAKGE